jgi:hypothetical protein
MRAARSLVDGNRLVDHRAKNRHYTMGELLIEGSAAVLSMDGEGVLRLRRHGSNDEETLPSDWPRGGFGGGSVERLQRHVVDNILRGGSVMNTARDYLANLRVEEAVYDSAAGGTVRSVQCGCLETARLLNLGPVEVDAAFSNAFVLRERRDELKEAASKVIREWTGGTLLVVTHGANILALTGHHPNSGEIVVVAPGATQLRAVGRISVPR